MARDKARVAACKMTLEAVKKGFEDYAQSKQTQYLVC